MSTSSPMLWCRPSRLPLRDSSGINVSDTQVTTVCSMPIDMLMESHDFLTWTVSSTSVQLVFAPSKPRMLLVATMQRNCRTALSELNRHRSGAQTAIKREMRVICKGKTPHEMISVANWEKCLKRDLDATDADDLELFEACCDQIMTKATGATERWNASHKGYFCLHNGHPPNKKGQFDCCVTPETEAHACLVLKGNWNCWHAQFQTADKSQAISRRRSTIGLTMMSLRPLG